MPPVPDDDPPDPLPGWYLAFWTLPLGALFTYCGARALITYRAGARDDASDPWIGILGLLAGPWMILMAARLIRGAKGNGPLFGSGELLCYSIFALTGGLWALPIAPMPQALLLPGAGCAGLALWWVRRSRSRGNAA